MIESSSSENIWKTFIQRHWHLFIAFIGVMVLAIIGAILVFLWVVQNVQLAGIVPESLGLWSMNSLIMFILNLLLWEFIYIGIPIIVFVLLVYGLWWKRLPDIEREEYKEKKLFSSSKSHKSDAGGAISFLTTVFFVFKVYLDGNWETPFATWNFNYLVYSYLWAFIWVAVIFGIPLLIGGSWWIYHQLHKKT